jgi:hypothetical protein
MKKLRLVIPAAILGAGFLICTTASYGTSEYAKKEGGKACTYCHAKVEGKDAMAKNINDTGKCYQTNGHKDLAKCPATPAKKS